MCSRLCGSKEGLDPFGSIVRSLSLHLQRLFPQLEPTTSQSQGSRFSQFTTAPRLPFQSLQPSTRKISNAWNKIQIEKHTKSHHIQGPSKLEASIALVVVNYSYLFGLKECGIWISQIHKSQQVIMNSFTRMNRT